MSLVFNTKTYNADSFGLNAVSFVGPAHSFAMTDVLSQRRAMPKPVPTCSGVAKFFAKLTRTMNLTSAITPKWDAIADLTISLPVGSSDSDVDAFLTDFAAYVSTAAFKAAVKKLQIN